MKTFPSNAKAALRSGRITVSGAVRLATPAPVRLWGGYGPITLVGEAYQGVGDTGLVEVSAGALGTAEQGAQLTLSGVDPDIAGAVDQAALRGVGVVLWRLIFDGPGSTLLHAAPFLRGRVDKVDLTETSGGTSTLIVAVEGAARGLGRRSERMRTDADQRLISPTDSFFARVSYAGEKTIYAGGRPPERAGVLLGGRDVGDGGVRDPGRLRPTDMIAVV